MASRNATIRELVPGRRKSSDMLMDAGLVEPEEQQPTCSKMAKKKKKKRPQDEDEHDAVAAEPENKAARAKSRSHDSKADLKKKDVDTKVEQADKKAESFMDQAGTSTAFSRVQTDEDYAMSRTPTGLSISSLDSSTPKKVVTDIWINPKETVSWNLDSLVTLNVLGRGSFGIVYLVRHRINRQLAALKYIRKKNQNPEKERKRVEVEKSVWEAVTDHPFVVNFRAYFETAKGWCFVMEYLPEGSIRDLVRKKGPFKEETARLLSAQVALAIQHVHEKGKLLAPSGFLHRDISSSNVLIDSKGNAKLIDFGLSQIGTEAWCRCGSLAYMAPEVIRQELYGMSADWWSFGIVVFVMLVGKTPLAIYAAEKGVDLHLARRDIRYRYRPARLMRIDGSFLPLWSDWGRRITHKLIRPPKDVQLLEQIANSRGLYGVTVGLARHQPSTFGVLVASFTVGGLMSAVGISFLALRFRGRCGGQRVQVITPLYAELYHGCCMAISSITVIAIVANVLLAGFAFSVQKSIREASAFYGEAFDNLERYAGAQPRGWNGSRQAARDTALQTLKLSKGFNEAFKRYLLQELNVNPFASKGSTCGKLLRAMLSEHSDLFDADCPTLEKTQEQLIFKATENFKKKTLAERKGLLQKLRVKVAEAMGGNDTSVKHLMNVRSKLRSFDKRTHLRQMFGGLAPSLMMVLSMVIGVVSALLVIALSMGMLNHDRGMAPTLRNWYSHRAGLILLYSPAIMFLSSIVAVPLAGLLLSGCVVGECYICDPFRGKHRQILDDAASKLLSISPVLVPSRILQSCSVSLRLSKFFLVMDQYCYAGWDERILRRAPRRRKSWKKRLGTGEPPSYQESSKCSDEDSDLDSKKSGVVALKDGDTNGTSVGQHGDEAGPWHSESWLLGSVSGIGPLLAPHPVSEATPRLICGSSQGMYAVVRGVWCPLRCVNYSLALAQNPKRRLGCRPEGGFDDLMKNPFYAPIDWSEVSCK
ncbi:unnamed protein product [Ixodes hexagonus]